MKLIECFSEEDMEKYFGSDFDPLEQGGNSEKSGSDAWNMPCNPDDTHSAMWAYFCEEYLPEHYPELSADDCDDLASIIANAFWAGNTVGHKNGSKVEKD